MKDFFKKTNKRLGEIDFQSYKKKQLQKLHKVRQEFIEEFDRRIAELHKRTNFIKEVFQNRALLKKEKISVLRNFFTTSFLTNLRHLASVPFIYMMIIPGIVLHIFLELYHQVCFRLYKIPLVKTSEYFVFDRYSLPYLNLLEKINCIYCSYFNCLIAYVREIAGRTEKYWCPIKHAQRVADPHSQYGDFVEYSDAKGLRENWGDLREFKNKKNMKQIIN